MQEIPRQNSGNEDSVVSNKDAVVSVENLSVKFGEFYAVKKISFQVQKGEIFGFLGANGAGKTTTIRVLCGLLHPTEGKVTIAGLPFETPVQEMAIKKKVGYMSQKFTLYNDMTVKENFDFIASLRNLKSKQYLQRRHFILDFISFRQSLDAFVKELSGGIKQQVSLAAAMLHDPEIIFLDEPTAGVTPYMRSRFWELIRELANLGKTVFVTTHYMDEAEHCGRIALMRDGEIIAMDTPNNLKTLAFKETLYEFDPIKQIPYNVIIELKENPEFDFFEPYGLRFHAVFKKTKTTEMFKKTLKGQFNIQAISPTLEDVFIKMVEKK